MQGLLSNCWNDNEGQDLVEYALLLAMITVIIASAVLPHIGNFVASLFTKMANAF